MENFYVCDRCGLEVQERPIVEQQWMPYHAKEPEPNIVKIAGHRYEVQSRPIICGKWLSAIRRID